MNIYRLYGHDCALLYIGVSSDVSTRVEDHRRKSWGSAIARVETEGPYDYLDALAREHQAIYREQPIHNIASKNGLTADQMARAAAAEKPRRPRRTPRDTPRPSWLTLGEAARRLGVSVDTVRRWESEGKITSTRTPGNQRRFAASEIERLLGEAA